MRGQIVSRVIAPLLVLCCLIPLVALVVVLYLAVPVWLAAPAGLLAVVLLARRLMALLNESGNGDDSRNSPAE